jgi:uncharacterized delta-60 repeat protein
MLRLTILLLLTLAAPAAARPGDLDRTFGTRGRTAFTSGPGYTAAGDVAPRPDGGIFVAGNGTMQVGEPWTGGATLARLTTGGRLQSRTFLTVPPPAPYDTDLGTQRLAVLPDGRALVAATLYWDTHWRLTVFRVHADGTLDTSFGTGGGAIAGELRDLAGMGVDAAGRIVIAATPQDDQAAVVTRLLPDGAPDPSYGEVSLSGSADALLVRRDGSAVVATTRFVHAKPVRVSLVALDAGGHRVRTSRITMHAHGSQAGASALAPGARGSVLLAGTDVGRRQYGWVARVRADGSVDRRFGRRTFVSRYREVAISDIARDRHGRIVVVGARSCYSTPQTLIARLTPSGRRDRRFGRDGTVLLQIGARAGTYLVASEAAAVAIDKRGRIVVAGAAYDDNSEIREDLGRSYFAVARLEG